MLAQVAAGTAPVLAAVLAIIATQTTTTVGAIVVFAVGVVLGMIGLVLVDVHQAVKAKRKRRCG